MDVEIQQPREVGGSKVVKVDKDEAWELFTDQASKEGRAVGFPLPLLFCSPPTSDEFRVFGLVLPFLLMLRSILQDRMIFQFSRHGSSKSR